MSRSILVAAALLGLACGGPSTSTGRSDTPPALVMETQAPFAQQPDVQERVRSTIDAALRYWGGSWDDLRGIRIVVTDAPSVPCSGRQALGCFDGAELRFTTLDPALGVFSCVEETVLVHEIGHVVIGDATHEDPRWMQMDPVAGELSGRLGYTPDGEAPCLIYLSVWRHPLGSP